MTRLALSTLACLALLGCSTQSGAPVSDPRSIVLPYEWGGNIDKDDFNEPSGITYHAGRGTLFVVGDEGEVCELTTEGIRLNYMKMPERRDLEGITSDPSTGLLYVAVEGEEKVLEMDPDSFEVRREFAIPRSAGDEELFQPGGQGMEAICFVPDAEHPEGGTFFVANQSFEEGPGKERSLVVQVELPLRSGGVEPVRILSWFEPGVIDIGGLHYVAATGHLLMAGDAANVLIESTTSGQILQVWAFTGNDQEGIVVDDEGVMYITQDSGGIIKITPRW